MRLQAHHTPPSGQVYHSNGLSLRLLGRCLRITNFVELRKSEVQLRRIPIPRTRVNEGPELHESSALNVGPQLSSLCLGGHPAYGSATNSLRKSRAVGVSSR